MGMIVKCESCGNGFFRCSDENTTICHKCVVKKEQCKEDILKQGAYEYKLEAGEN